MHRDVLFIHPGSHKKTYQYLSKEYTAIAPPVWIALLANYIRNEGHTVAVYDVNVEGWDENIAKHIIQETKMALLLRVSTYLRMSA